MKIPKSQSFRGFRYNLFFLVLCRLTAAAAGGALAGAGLAIGTADALLSGFFSLDYIGYGKSDNENY